MGLKICGLCPKALQGPSNKIRSKLSLEKGGPCRIDLFFTALNAFVESKQ